MRSAMPARRGDAARGWRSEACRAAPNHARNLAGAIARGGSRGRVRARVAQQSAAPTIADIPAEPGWPVLGKAAWVVKSVGATDPVTPYFEKHASDFVNINRGPLGGWIVATRDREAVTAILNSEDFEPAWPVSLLRMLSGSERTRSHAVNKQWRRASSKVLRPETVARLHVPLMITAFDARIRAGAAAGEPVAWAHMTRRMAFEVATRASVGDLVSQADMDELYGDFDAFLAGSFAMDFGRQDGMPRTLYRRSSDARARIAAFLSARITAAVSQYRRGALSSPVVEALFQAYDEAGEDLADPQTLRTVINTVIELMWAGTGTTAHSLGSLAQLLAAHPDWFAHAQREQDRLAAEHGPALTGKVLSQSYVAQAITHEVLRLKAPVSAVMRIAVRDTLLPTGLAVPSGTKFWLRMREMNNDAYARGGSKAFSPAQWLSYPPGETPGTAAPTAYRPSQSVEASLVFGGGPRKCVGNNLAVTEMIAAVATLVRGTDGVRMAAEERDRTTFAMFKHPTGMPVELLPRGAGDA